ncbi:MAG TPA: hypothetical protein VN642_05950 [Dongiaceae bacterium]|nr:hypothetical protein [Dongiaceae bacterium]
MDDLQAWHQGVARLGDLLAGLPAGTGQMLTRLLTGYRKAKEALAAVIADVDATTICRDCCGQCCLNGKYRMNVFDALARIAANIPTTADFSQKPVCPYGTEAGCSMEPGYRPADCILFICDAIDQKLSVQDRLVLAAEEQALRRCLHEASTLTGEQMGTPLLLWAGKSGNKPKV